MVKTMAFHEITWSEHARFCEDSIMRNMLLHEIPWSENITNVMYCLHLHSMNHV